MKSGMVQIVIKAPNQMIEDQIIECDRLWTVSQLKEHLSKEYPTHPHAENQKLIYSGKLLSDELLLTDVLKTYGGHEYNTIHLVCSIRENNMIYRNKTMPETVQPTAQVINQPVINIREQPMYWLPPQSVLGALPRNYDELHITEQNSNSLTNIGVYLQTQQQHLAQQMRFIQRAYILYMTEYMAMMVRDNERNVRINEEPVHEVPQNQVAAEVDVEEEPGPQRDWLDWMYISTRLIILFAVIYLYSSPLRFIVVMTMAFLLFNMDVERWRRRPEDAGGPDAAGQRQQRQQFQQQAAGDAAVADNNIQQNNNNNNNNNNLGRNNSQQPTANNPLQEQPPQNPHPLHVVSTFITSFFLSIIPEQRAI